MISTKANKLAKKVALIARANEWQSKRPKAPYDREPKFRSVEESGMFFGAFFPCAIIGFFVGFEMIIANSPIGADNSWILFAPLWMPFACGFGIPIVLSIIINSFLLLGFLIAKAEWKKYEESMAIWTAKVREELKENADDFDVRQILRRY